MSTTVIPDLCCSQPFPMMQAGDKRGKLSWAATQKAPLSQNTGRVTHHTPPPVPVYAVLFSECCCFVPERLPGRNVYKQPVSARKDKGLPLMSPGGRWGAVLTVKCKTGKKIYFDMHVEKSVKKTFKQNIFFGSFPHSSRPPCSSV